MPYGREELPPSALSKPHYRLPKAALLQLRPASPREGVICIYEDLKANVHLTGFRRIFSVK